MQIVYLQITAPFNARAAVYEVAAVLKDNVCIETSTQLTETHQERDRRLNLVRALAIAIVTTIFGVDRLQKAFAARPLVRSAMV